MLEAFSKLGSDNPDVRREAGKDIFSYISKNASELEYSVTRLLRGLESHKVATRTGSYSALASLLGFSKLQPVELRDLVAKTLVTDQQTTKKDRRLVYIARILACGVTIRTVPLAQLLSNEILAKGILNDLVDLGKKRSTLLELSTPFLCHLINDKQLTSEAFDSIVWPCLLPLFTKTEVKAEDEGETDLPEKAKISVSVLQIALTCFDRGLKTDFDFLTDMNQIVQILLAKRVANITEIVSLVVNYAKKQDLSEEFWNALVPQIRSSHFDTVCICVRKSVEAGIPHNFIVREEIVTPLLSVFRNDDASEQHTQAVSTLGSLLKWNNSGESKLGKKLRKSAMKIMFGGSPSLLHEYQKLLRIIKPFLAETCTEKDLTVLMSIIEKRLGAETTLTVRMGIVYLQFLSRIAQSKKASVELMIGASKRLLGIGFGKEKLNFSVPGDEDNGEEEKTKTKIKDETTDAETDKLVSKLSLESFQSILTSTYNPEFLDDIFQFIIDDLDTFSAESKVKKSLHSVDKLRKKTQDSRLRYILGAYAIRVVLEQDKVLGEAQIVLEELISLAKSVSTEDASSEIVQFILSSVTKDERPPFDYEGMFSRLLIEGKITESAIQQFADVIDVEVSEVDEDSEDDDSADEEENGGKQMEVDSDDDAPESGEEVVAPVKEKVKRVQKAANGDIEESDAESSIDMDEATEEDLKSMDNALGKVFAIKKKVKEEETSEVRSLMRTFRLLETLLTRNSKGCHISIPLILLMPVIHSLQHSIGGKKSNRNLSTRIVSVLNKLNAIKKIDDVDSVEEGTLFNMARELVAMSKQGQSRMIADLLGDSLVMLTKCYLQSSKSSKGEDVGFTTLYTGMMDMKEEKRSKSMGIASNVISSALTTLPNWAKEKEAICKHILSVIFNPDVRHFRRMQFLVLLRAALNDKTYPADSITNWRPQAIKDLVTHASTYFSKPSAIPTHNLTRELLQTFNDANNDPALKAIVAKFFKKISKNNDALHNLSAASKQRPKLKSALTTLGLSLPLTNGTPQKLKRKSDSNIPDSVTPPLKMRLRKSLAKV